MSIFFHEQLYRTSEVMAQLRDYPVTVCGAGALGANITENLARSGFGKLKVIDCDRIEERNLSTQPYYRSDIGAHKAKILAHSLYQAVGVKLEAKVKELTTANTKQLLTNSTLVIDTFDNSVARQAVKDYCDNSQTPCLHVGLAEDYSEIIWNENYRVPSPVNDDVCDYPLARNLVLMTTAVATEVIIEFISTTKKLDFTFTLRDLTIKAIDRSS
ncbi:MULTISPECIES: ThiF family adenylyltransferase [unclassified Moorena]|uniref:ThiF family adenylyltransferase n=1 Tax=unclassified Moorena TaxID=2683338 RepID=UPI0013C9FA13|nr:MULTISPECIES: ThiF family adenylyltransferase [unclassified Moorena]NEO18410.1 ThiF family adenylyltransferase [Moorena sp. SIO4A5]NEQ57448.1 ThiF family adenylyltransferase [Moorena sp. SIO4A1]